MERPTKVHCFFEQSGTFKREFLRIGIPAEDYDIQDHFGETDHIIDIFLQIEAAYDGRMSIFDAIGRGDLIMAFFPCIYFCCNSQMLFAMGNRNHRNKTPAEICDYVIERNRNRSLFYERLVKMIGICFRRDLRMILENPWAEQTHLKEAFLKRPDIVDADRMARGDYFTKPTAYWFWNCAPTHGSTMQRDKPKIDVMSLPQNPVAGMCSEARSMISPDYARNFIADFILGVPLSPSAYQQGELPLGLEAVT